MFYRIKYLVLGKNMSYLTKKKTSIDLHIDIANEDRIRTIIYDKRIDFNFPIVNILFIYSIIPAASVCVVYIPTFVFILNFLNRGLLLTRKLLNQG